MKLVFNIWHLDMVLSCIYSLLGRTWLLRPRDALPLNPRTTGRHKHISAVLFPLLLLLALTGPGRYFGGVGTNGCSHGSPHKPQRTRDYSTDDGTGGGAPGHFGLAVLFHFVFLGMDDVAIVVPMGDGCTDHGWSGQWCFGSFPLNAGDKFHLFLVDSWL